jgi:hypothetical protein
MKVIKSSIIPFKGFKAINLFGVVFHRKGTSPLTKVELNHEAIHTAQIKEWLYLPYYLVYVLNYLSNLLIREKSSCAPSAYRGIGFEEEAYKHQDDLNYLKTRKLYATFVETKGDYISLFFKTLICTGILVALVYMIVRIVGMI